MTEHDQEEHLDRLLAEAGIDPKLSRWVLQRVRTMDKTSNGPADVTVESFPLPRTGRLSIEEQQGGIIDISKPEDIRLAISGEQLKQRLEDFALPAQILSAIYEDLHMADDMSESRELTASELEHIGYALLPRVSYGILNGGSATSYADEKKNRKFHSQLLDFYRTHFDAQGEACRGVAKGLTPGYLNPDGTTGLSYIQLKIRRAMVMAGEHYRRFPQSRQLNKGETPWPKPLFPLFQMTSSGNDQFISQAYEEYREHPALAPLADQLGLKDEPWFLTGVQPLIAALTHSEHLQQDIRRFFLNAHQKPDTPLALPGGHGQNFFALEDVYATLRSQGKQLAYLGNVDNLGFLPDALEIALLALLGSPAGFDFSYKTPVDVKGGVLYRAPSGTLSCGDIGPSVSPKRIEQAEREGTPILFNCATGLFRLDYLVDNLSRIQEELPLRVSDQDKDAGRYAQAEQVTWEVMELMPGFTGFAVHKFTRFLAGKLILENFLTSGLDVEDAGFPEDMRELAQQLYSGFSQLMEDQYHMTLSGSRWEPKP